MLTTNIFVEANGLFSCESFACLETAVKKGVYAEDLLIMDLVV